MYYVVNTPDAKLEKKRPYTKQRRQNKDEDAANSRLPAQRQEPAISNLLSRAILSFPISHSSQLSRVLTMVLTALRRAPQVP